MIYITSQYDFNRYKSRIYDNALIGIDTETTALRPKDGSLRLIQIYGVDQNEVFVLDVFHLGKDFLREHLKDLFETSSTKKIAHNLKFEYQWILSDLGLRLTRSFDTYLASQMVDFYGEHSLRALVEKYCGVTLNKDAQSSNWEVDLSLEQLEYAARDTLYLPKLREELLGKLQRTGQVGAYSLEISALPAIAEMELAGIPIDVKKYGMLVEKLVNDAQEKSDALLQFLQTRNGTLEPPPPVIQTSLFGSEDDKIVSKQINVNSLHTVLPILTSMGFPVTQPGTKKMVELRPLLAEYPELQVLIDQRESGKLASTYGQSLLDQVSNGRLYTDFQQIGTITTRMSSRKPNMQNIPHTKDFRSCFSAAGDSKLVIADYSQMELRILASVSNDAVMLKAYREGIDIHSMTTSNVFKIPLSDVPNHKDLRNSAKITNFSTVYGISPKALAMRLKAQGIDKADEVFAETLINGFLSGYPQAARWLVNQENSVRKNPWVTTVAGHKIPLRYDRNDSGSFRSAQRNARNYPIQSGNACVIKRALFKIHEDLTKNYPDVRMVLTVHDEIVLEDPKGREAVRALLEKHMVESGSYYYNNVPIVADAAICDNWSEK